MELPSGDVKLLSAHLLVYALTEVCRGRRRGPIPAAAGCPDFVRVPLRSPVRLHGIGSCFETVSNGERQSSKSMPSVRPRSQLQLTCKNSRKLRNAADAERALLLLQAVSWQIRPAGSQNRTSGDARLQKLPLLSPEHIGVSVVALDPAVTVLIEFHLDAEP